jgi:flagellar basal-body rod modification protein FlgD
VTTESVANSSATSYVQTKSAPKANNADPLASKDMFLQLLVAQIKNQNPLNPTDGVQFLSQLAQFTQVEQSTQIRDDLQAIRGLLETQAESSTITADGRSGAK